MVAAAVSVAATTVITGETAPEYIDTYPLASALEFWRARNTSPRTPQMISTCAQVKISCQRANSRLLASGGTARVLEGLDICQLTSRL